MVPSAFAYEDKGDFYLRYQPTQYYQEYEDWLKTEQYFENQIPFLNSVFKLPYDIEIAIADSSYDSDCQYPNAWYDSYNRQIVMCYELIEETDYRFFDFFNRNYNEDAWTNEDLNYSLINVIEHTLYHEVGHALIDIYRLPVTGPQEDVADEFGAYILLGWSDQNIGQDAVLDTAIDFWLSYEENPEFDQSDYADTHGLTVERFYNLTCLVYGYDPNGNQYLVTDGWLPENRYIWCEEEYYQMNYAWDTLLGQHFHEGILSDSTTPPVTTPPVTTPPVTTPPVTTPPVTTPQQQTQGPVVKEVIVNHSIGSWQTGCEKTNSCFDPYRVVVNIGDTVTWQNVDSADHSVTSGTLLEPDGAFDSGLMQPGSSFSVEFPYEGTYPYFDMIHPWKQGSVVVSSIVAVPPTQQQTQQPTQQPKGGGCLIATAAFGSEMAPQVQFLRELRDNTVLQTESGTNFMTGFNQFYYSFSPAVADYERENPAFKEAVKITLTPLLASLTLLQYADIDSESEMLGYGIGVILLNIGMYFVAPAVLIMAVRKRI